MLLILMSLKFSEEPHRSISLFNSILFIVELVPTKMKPQSRFRAWDSPQTATRVSMKLQWVPLGNPQQTFKQGNIQLERE